jgi:hypothetical protein
VEIERRAEPCHRRVSNKTRWRIPCKANGAGDARGTQGSWGSGQGHGGRAVDYAGIERQGAAGAAAIERASHQAVLQGLDIDRPHVVIEGKEYRRVGRYEADYYTLAGPVRIVRTLYRECGQRNAKTVNAVSLRCGAVGEGWLPATAQAMAHQLQQGTSREAESTAQILGRLPYARSSFESIGQAVGRQYTAVRVDLEESLIEEYTVPADVASISVALDRVSVPMEEAGAVAEREPQPRGAFTPGLAAVSPGLLCHADAARPQRGSRAHDPLWTDAPRQY